MAQGCVFELLVMFCLNLKLAQNLNVSLNLQRHFAGYNTNNSIYYELLLSKNY